jgi:integrase
MLDLGIVGGKRRRKTVYGQTEREVLDKLRQLRASRDRGRDILIPAQTVGHWLEVWLSEIKSFDGTRPATLTLYCGLADRYVKPVIGNVRLDKLTPAHVQHLMSVTRNTDTARGRPPSAATLMHVYKLIRSALGDAYRMELVTRNVATQVKPPPLNRDRRTGLDIDDAKRLLQALSGERLEAFYVLALTTGLRRGELLGLRWEDIDLESRQLREHRMRPNTERLTLGEAWHDHGLVFASSIGTPIEPRNINRRWDVLRQNSGLEWLRLQTYGTDAPPSCSPPASRPERSWKS